MESSAGRNTQSPAGCHEGKEREGGVVRFRGWSGVSRHREGSERLVRIEFLYWEDCPSHPEALRRLREVMREEGLDDAVEVIRIDTMEDAERHRFPGSPTIRIEGEDLQPEGVQGQPTLSCRTYAVAPGRLSPLPTAEMIRGALRRARRAQEGGGSWR
jgi:hypothetical protein